MRSISRKALVKSTCLLHCKESTPMPQRRPAGSIFFPPTSGLWTPEAERLDAITWVRMCCSERSNRPCGMRVFENPLPVTRCATHLRRICWSGGRISAQCRSCLGIRIYARRRSIPMSHKDGLWALSARWRLYRSDRCIRSIDSAPLVPLQSLRWERFRGSGVRCGEPHPTGRG